MSFFLASTAGTLFVLLLILFGWLVSVRLLMVTSLPAALGGGFTIGPAAYMVCVNALGYILPIRWAFGGGLVILGALSLALLVPMLFRKESFFPSLEAPPRFVLWVLGTLG